MSRADGFTLFELLIVLVMVAIVTAIAIPNFRGFIGSQSLKNVTQSLYGHLVYARSEAIKRNADVSVVANNGDWADGWLVTAASATSIDCDSGAFEADVLLAGCAAADSGVLFQQAPAADIVFRGNGRANAGARFELCDPDRLHGREVRVGIDGMPRIVRLDSCP